MIAARRVGALLIMVTLAACLETPGVLCADGTLCPEGATCATVGGATYCASADQLAQCAGASDGAVCPLSGQSSGVCRDGVCVRAGCGDGIASAPERCDGADLHLLDTDGDGATCRDAGYYGDTPLTCRADCTPDLSVCLDLGTCGDGVRNGAEQCDGPDLGGADCRVGGFYDAGGLACNTACRFDFELCTGRCGDGQTNGAEECDGSVPAELDTCGEHGFQNTATPVGCGADCRYDTGACAGFCGDGMVSGGEQCDGAELDVADQNGDQVIDCRDLGYYEGALTCLPNCQRNLLACAGRCGDGTRQAGEACDGTDFGAETCTSRGFYTGTLGCDAACATISTAACSGRCGDQIVNGPERCDGSTFPAGVSCTSLGYYQGTLACNAACSSVSTAQCSGYCGDGIVNAGSPESCDGLVQLPFDTTCATSGTNGVGPLGCDALCRPTFDRCEAGAWTVVPGLNELGEPADVWTAAVDDVWFAIDAGAAGTKIRRRVEGRWVALGTVPIRALAVWSGANLALAAGAGGAVYRLQPSGTQPAWVPFASPGGETISDLWGARVDAIFATTEGGKIYRWNGASWILELAGAPPLRAIHGTPDGFAVAVGSTVIATRAAGAWTWFGITGFEFEAVAVRSPLDLWVVGRDGASHLAQLHYDGAAWVSEPRSPVEPSGPQHGVVASSADDVWMGGGAGPSPFGWGGTLFRFDGTTVNRFNGSWGWIAALAGADTGDLWTASWDAIVNRTTALHKDAELWRPRPQPLAPGAAVTEIVANPDATWLAAGTSLVRHDNRRASRDPARAVSLAPAGGFGGPITALWATGLDQAFVFAGATVWRYDAGAWTSTALAGPVEDAWGTGGHVFAVGGNRIHHWNGASWTTELHGSGLRTVSGTALDDVWFAGDGYHRRVGPGQFVDLPPPQFAMTGVDVHAVSPDYVVFVGETGGAGMVQTWALGAWFLPPPFVAPEAFHAVTGSGANDLWAAGEQQGAGYVAHWDGTSWTPFELDGFPPPWRALAATSPRDVWAGGDSGDVWHLDQQLTALTGGACPAAAPLGCTVPLVPNPGAVVDGERVYYTLDAPFTGQLIALLTPTAGPVELRVFERGLDGTCDVLAPLATTSSGALVPMVVGRRYYLELGTIAPVTSAGFRLEVACQR